MKKLIAHIVCFAFGLYANAADFITTKDGIIVHPDVHYPGSAKEVQLKVIAENIIRVIAVGNKNFREENSQIITANKNPNIRFAITSDKKFVRLKTSMISAVVNLQTGAIYFFDADGKTILKEKENSRELQSTVFDGEALYSIRQNFETVSDDAWYGLGQHQDGLMNYKTYQVQLFQNNTEVAVPFLVSKKIMAFFGIMLRLQSLVM